MIQTKEQINSNHHIEGLTPDWFIELPFKKDENFEQVNVTCVFSMDEHLNPRVLVPIGLDYYYEKVDNKILEDTRFDNKVPRYVYVFKEKPFNIEDTRHRLLHL